MQFGKGISDEEYMTKSLGKCISDNAIRQKVLLDFLLTVKAAPHECVIRTGQP